VAKRIILKMVSNFRSLCKARWRRWPPQTPSLGEVCITRECQSISQVQEDETAKYSQI